jgi:hypothetical protein
MSIFEKGRGREPGANLARFSNFFETSNLNVTRTFLPQYNTKNLATITTHKPQS